MREYLAAFFESNATSAEKETIYRNIHKWLVAWLDVTINFKKS